MKTIFFLLLFLPFFASAQTDKETFAKLTKGAGFSDTVKIFMLVCDTSTVKGKPGYQDTRPFMMYGFQTKKGELLDAYKQKLSKNIIMWIAYKTK